MLFMNTTAFFASFKLFSRVAKLVRQGLSVLVLLIGINSQVYVSFKPSKLLHSRKNYVCRI